LSGPWEVIFYETEAGNAPAEEGIRKLTKRVPKDGLLINAQMNKLRISGPFLSEPDVKPVVRDVRELRCKGLRGTYRLLFFFYDLRQTYVILHTILKAKTKTPQNAKDTARKRKVQFLSSQ